MDTQQQQPSSRRIVKKITTKIIMGGKLDIETLIDYGKVHGKDATMPLFGIIGMATDYMPGQSEHGAYVKLIGTFKAVNVATGEEFRSGCCILPGSGNDMVYGALKGLGDAGGSVEFVFRVGVIRDQSSAVGYVFVVDQVSTPGQADPLAALEQRMLSNQAPAAVIADRSSDLTSTDENQETKHAKKKA